MEKSNTEGLCHLLMQELTKYNVESEIVRLADYNIPPGLILIMPKSWRGI